MKMMLAIGALAAMIVGATWLHAPPAECAFCGNAFCLNSTACFQGCACVVQDYGGTGVCMNVR